MRNLSIGKQILGGFGAVLTLMVLIAAVGFGTSFYLGNLFTDYRHTARQTLTVSDLAENLFKARMNALKYRILPSDENAEGVFSNIQKIEDAAPLAETLFADNAEKLSVLRQITEKTAAYRKGFEDMRQLQAQREKLVNVLSEIGPKARQQMTKIGETAFRDGDPRAAFYAGRVQEQLLLGRFFTERYLLTNSDAALSRAKEHLETAQKEAVELLKELENPERRALATASSSDVDLYLKTVLELSEIISARNMIRTDGLDVIGPQMEDDYDHILERIVDLQNQLGPHGAAAVQQTKLLVAGLATVALMFGAFIAYKIATSLIGTVNKLAGKMEDLSQGDLNVEIEGTQYDHELGRMARALEIFKENGSKIKQLADEKEKADEIAETGRKAMTSALSTVVDAAVNGDFSHRMATDFEDSGHVEMAKAVNQMISSVDEGVSETSRIISKLADGVLDEHMHGDFKGAFLELQSAVNSTLDQLAHLVGQIVETSSAMNHNVSSISTGSQKLSDRASRQAASLEETAATMEEMSSSVKANAQSAAEVSKMVTEVQDRATDGGNIVETAIDGMSKIEAGAAKISDIITVIDGIAFQTNLLALNAAVEAARAGDAGKGFAVVASEVRTLAQRAGGAASDIRTLIEESNGQIGDGVRLVTQTGSALQGIIEGITTVENSIHKIASANEEQSSGISEVTNSIGQLDGITQENAMMANQSASAASSLTKHSQQLQELIVFFKLRTEANLNQQTRAA